MARDDTKTAFDMLAAELTGDDLAPFADGLKQGGRARRTALNKLVSHLSEVGDQLHASNEVPPDRMSDWWRVFEAAQQLRTVAWAERNGEDGQFVTDHLDEFDLALRGRH